MKLIDEARQAGARLAPACRELGVTVRTYQRWTEEEPVREDQRPRAQRPEPANKLRDDERAQILDVCSQPEYASLPPAQIVPRLADQGIYLASESSFYRVLRAEGAARRRGRERPARAPASVPRLLAQGPCRVWSWDISWLPGPVKGLFFYLYLIMDLYSRKIVAWEVHEREFDGYAAELVQRAVLAENVVDTPLILHADNGSPMKGETLLTTLYRLGVVTSYSRPRTSNDNPYSEALFRTCKYCPSYPSGGFDRLEQARLWVQQFVHGYNTAHRHSAIRFVTPEQRHRGDDRAILEQRQALYETAREQHPERWAGSIRNWSPVSDVWLNRPDPDYDASNSAEQHDAAGRRESDEGRLASAGGCGVRGAPPPT